jgi:hypothetical protein
MLLGYGSNENEQEQAENRNLNTDMLAAVALGALASAYTKPVTAVAVYNGDVYVGRPDGVVQRVGPDLQVQDSYAKTSNKPISFVAASAFGVAWLSGPGGAIREKAAPPKPVEQTLTISFGDKQYSVAIQPSSPIRRLEWLQGRVGVSYDFGAAFYDGKGHEISPSSFMPPDAAELAKSASLWVREQEDGTEFAVFAKPYAVRQSASNQKAPLVSMFTAYQVGAWQWAKLGGFASNAFDAFPDGEMKVTEDGKLAGDSKFLVLSDRVALSGDGIVAREPDSMVNAPVFGSNWEVVRVESSPIPGDALWAGAGGDSAWWWNGSALVQQNRRTGNSCAYLPWGEPTIAPTSFAADADGLWVGSNRGLRHLDPAKPEEKLGYAGFVRAPFGTANPDPGAKKLSDAVFAWRFATEDKAGTDGGLMVASIFSVFGQQLPQTAPGLINAGAPVADELRFGDVILTQRSAAVYLGNGATVEVRSGRVQNGEIWAFPKATVRRFLPEAP